MGSIRVKKWSCREVANPEDKRSKLLVLTEYAESKRDEFIVLEDSIEKEMMDGLSEMEVEVLSELLEKVIEKHNNGGKL